MNLNSKCRIIAYLLTLAFALPIVIKAEHMMFPNHEHHGHSCSHNTNDFENTCEIQDFDYFYFTPAGLLGIPAITIFKFEIPFVESTQKSYKESKLPYGLRAPPFIVS